MKITVLITTYNRPAYLKRCLDSIKRSDLKGADVFIIDDASNNKETKEIIEKSNFQKYTNLGNRGICYTLLHGIHHAFKLGYDIVTNLDSDAIVRNDWMEVLLNLHAKFPDKIITGFHSTTKNKDGSERHKIIKQGECFISNDNYELEPSNAILLKQEYIKKMAWAEKESVGGINMLFTKETFEKYAKPALEKCLNGGNWDHQTCINAGSVICTVPSVVQHIGTESSLGHMHDKPDVADDFKMFHLPNVTLVCIDDNTHRAMRAIEESEKNIEFGDVQLLPPNFTLGSKEAYSKFILTELYKYIDTDFALIVQHDGYVKNPEAWTDEFLKYDYIGAPWWYKDEMKVGNGGFSLRSKKLLQKTAEFFTDLPFKNLHPEDHVICRTYRKNFDAMGIKFAPIELASKFSFEGYMQPGHWDGQFGFHGDRAFRRPPDPKKEGFIINQFLGLGDILFLVPLVRKWMSQGHDIIWPVADEYFNMKEYFPDIQFVKKSDWPGVRYDSRTEYMHKWQYGLYRVKPLRWNMCHDIRDAMTSKYTMCGEDWQIWRELKWQRNENKEVAFFLNRPGEFAKENYCLVCDEYGNITDGGTAYKKIEPKTDLPIVKLQRLPGFSLLDWAGIIENASEIHAVSSSTFYLFEMLNLKAKEIHLYSRKLGQKDFTYIEKLFTKNYILHV